jgi:hypothetical protein
MPVTEFELRDDRAVPNIQGGKQRGGAMPLIVMSDAFGIAKPQGQHGCARSKACT